MRVKTGPGEGRWGKAFLGGGDRGEVSNPVNQKTAVNTIPQFLHKASAPSCTWELGRTQPAKLQN